MSVFELDQRGAALSLGDAPSVRLENVEPSFGYRTSYGFGMGLAKGGARVGQAIGMAGAAIPIAFDAVTGGGTKAQDAYFSTYDEVFQNAVDYWTPRAEEVGTAGRLLGGLAEMVLPLAAGGGNPTLLLGAQGLGTGTDLAREGVDPYAAAGVGTVQAAATAGGFAIPFLGKNLLQRIGLGAAGNLATNVPADAASQQILRSAGATQQAERFDPLSLEARALDVIAGGAFGGVGHLLARAGDAEDARAARAAVANARQLQQDSAPRPLDTPEVNQAHQQAIEAAIDQFARGEPVQVPPMAAQALDGAAQAPRPEMAAAVAESLAELGDVQVPGVAGRASTVLTERGLRVAVQYRLVESAELTTSHSNDLAANPAFPAELQPRQRERAASAAQVASIENAIRPELLGDSAKASDGAPIIGPDGVVESGNARTIALRRAYGSGKAGGYRAWLGDNAERFGLTREQVDSMRQPVLVRSRVGDVDRAEFARQANESSVARMSPAEQAQSDAARLRDLDGLAAADDGSINMVQSADFLRRFMQDVVPPTERGDMLQADGRLSQTGQARVRNAIFAKAYGDADLVAMLTESTDSNVRNILAGLLRAAPDVARLRDLQDAGARQPIDVATEIAGAARQFSSLRSTGTTVEQYLGQASLIDGPPRPELAALLQGLADNSRSAKRVAELVRTLTRSVDGLGDPRQAGLLDDAPPAAADLAAGAVERMKGVADGQLGDTPAAAATPPAVPELEVAQQVATRMPDMMIKLDDGTEVRAADLLARVQAELQRANGDAVSFDAAVQCFLGK